jgi:RHS repeat-associated protein
MNPTLLRDLHQAAATLEAVVVTQHVWGARPGHRDELILRDRATGAGTSSSSAEPLDERLWCLMDYYDPTAIVDNEGAVVERYRFSAFGLRAILDPDFDPRATSLYDWDFAFKGQFLDLESGYCNYGYRYYSPELGRWLSRDPIGETGGVNIYAMAGNCPLNTIDILGLASLGQYGADWLTSYAKPLKDLGDHWLGRALGVASLLLQGYECIVAVSNLLTRPECFDSVEVRGEWRGNVRSDVRSAISSCTGALSGSIAAITGNGFIVAAVTQAAALVAGFVSNYIDDSTIDSAFDLQPGPPLCCKNT